MSPPARRVNRATAVAHLLFVLATAPQKRQLRPLVCSSCRSYASISSPHPSRARAATFRKPALGSYLADHLQASRNGGPYRSSSSHSAHRLKKEDLEETRKGEGRSEKSTETSGDATLEPSAADTILAADSRTQPETHDTPNEVEGKAKSSRGQRPAKPPVSKKDRTTPSSAIKSEAGSPPPVESTPKVELSETNSVPSESEQPVPIIADTEPTAIIQSIKGMKTLATGPGQSESRRPWKKLYVDILNYSTNVFFFTGIPHWAWQRGVERVGIFVKACHIGHWDPVVFIDGTPQTAEADAKWRNRRTVEITQERRNIPQGLSVILGEAFKKHGVDVIYSYGADNDDTLAAFAKRDKAILVSNDGDFWRYTRRNYTIRKNLRLEVPHPNSRALPRITMDDSKAVKFKRRPTPREILDPVPEIRRVSPTLTEMRGGIYRRGAPSALVRKLGNPHIALRPLRQALYHRLGFTHPVKEIFPIWDTHTERVEWPEAQVYADPNPKWDALLDDHIAAFETLFPDEKRQMDPPYDDISPRDWHNHLFALWSLVCEVCALGQSAKGGKQVLLIDLLESATEEYERERKRRGLRTIGDEVNGNAEGEAQRRRPGAGRDGGYNDRPGRREEDGRDYRNGADRRMALDRDARVDSRDGRRPSSGKSDGPLNRAIPSPRSNNRRDDPSSSRPSHYDPPRPYNDTYPTNISSSPWPDARPFTLPPPPPPPSEPPSDAPKRKPKPDWYFTPDRRALQGPYTCTRCKQSFTAGEECWEAVGGLVRVGNGMCIGAEWVTCVAESRSAERTQRANIFHRWDPLLPKMFAKCEWAHASMKSRSKGYEEGQIDECSQALNAHHTPKRIESSKARMWEVQTRRRQQRIGSQQTLNSRESTSAPSEYQSVPVAMHRFQIVELLDSMGMMKALHVADLQGTETRSGTIEMFSDKAILYCTIVFDPLKVKPWAISVLLLIPSPKNFGTDEPK
ncbi:uncharacterized protein EV422DRAFT_508808 [Fimicolochytrium jonesii]|uniref:uncharacterized protein n=1 Tax=Fimicolochytrium jonesii TaxID=1396493 RepID=UPI0022FDF1EC|nr:uncharacterized protein EV422DRAFT_508808 [Fimicolochytrium jonesii]KAI8817740.1 hypothetical protein EV422DRAFT_508808 [Fimicolochytrium jonesii]